MRNSYSGVHPGSRVDRCPPVATGSLLVVTRRPVILGLLVILGFFAPGLPAPSPIDAAPVALLEDSWFPLQPGTRMRYRVLTGDDYLTWIVREDPRPGFVRLETLRHRSRERAWSALRVGADGIRFVEMHSITSPGDSLRSFPEWMFFAPPEEGPWGVDCFLRRFQGGRYVGAIDPRVFAYRHAAIETLEVGGRSFATLRVDQDLSGDRPQHRRSVWYAQDVGPVRIEASPMTWGLGPLELAPEDHAGPEPVGEVSIDAVTPFGARLSWDLPTDDLGILWTREVRLAPGALEDFDWETALPLVRDWTFGGEGARDSVWVDNLVPDRDFVVGIRYGDDLGNLQVSPRLVPIHASPAELFPGDFLPLPIGMERTYLMEGGEEMLWKVLEGDLDADRIVELTRPETSGWRVRLGLGIDDDGVDLLWIARGESPPAMFEPSLRLLRQPGDGRAWSFHGQLEADPGEPEPEPHRGVMHVLGLEAVDLAEERVEAVRIREIVSEVRGYDHWYAPGVGLVRSDRFPLLPELGRVLLAPAPGEDFGDDDGDDDGDGGGGGGKEIIPGVVRFIVRSPFRGQAAIVLQLREARRVRLDVFDPLGRGVVTLRDDILPAGDHDLVWDGRSGSGRGLPSGVYLVRLQAEGARLIHKVVKLP